MDTLQAFAIGEANRDKELMVFDWDKAVSIIKEHNLNLNLLDAYRKEDKTTQKEIYASLLTEFEKEISLDPRL